MLWLVRRATTTTEATQSAPAASRRMAKESCPAPVSFAADRVPFANRPNSAHAR